MCSPDWTHLYIWIAKDLSWTQNWFYPGCAAAAAALCVSCLCIARSFWAGDGASTFAHVMTLMWLFANAVWMYGEIRDANFPDQPLLYEKCRDNACAIMSATLAAMGIYYLQRCLLLLRRRHSEDRSATSQGAHVAVSHGAHEADPVHTADSGAFAVRLSLPAASHERACDGPEAAFSRQIDQQLLPRPFLRPLFPTWRDYEHVHVRALHRAPLALFTRHKLRRL